ncbi:hypothetical protein ACS5NO_31755 [Larkinella sp. GY13]|uniref:hypothetical protein n=1 Tax=Larkinella sp. GY13 TaxID=3453720 RepID=UPI003EEA9D66
MNLLLIFFIEFVCVFFFSCSKSGGPDISERYFGTYAVKMNTDLMDPSTGNHFFAKDSFLLIVDKSTTSSEISFTCQDSWTGVLNKNKFIITPHISKRTYGDIISQSYEVSGSGSFSGDSIYYIENLVWGGFGLRGKSQIVGVKQ